MPSFFSKRHKPSSPATGADSEARGSRRFTMPSRQAGSNGSREVSIAGQTKSGQQSVRTQCYPSRTEGSEASGPSRVVPAPSAPAVTLPDEQDEYTFLANLKKKHRQEPDLATQLGLGRKLEELRFAKDIKDTEIRAMKSLTEARKVQKNPAARGELATTMESAREALDVLEGFWGPETKSRVAVSLMQRGMSQAGVRSLFTRVSQVELGTEKSQTAAKSSRGRTRDKTGKFSQGTPTLGG